MPNNPHYPPERIAALQEAGRAAGVKIGQPNAGTTAGKHDGCPPHSIKKALNYLGRQPVKRNEKGQIKLTLPADPTPFQIIAAQSLQKAAAGDIRAIEYVTDRTDGKVIQPTLNSDLEKIKNMSAEEIQEEIDRVDRELAELQAGDESGFEAAADSGERTEGEAEDVPPAGVAGEIPLP